MILCAPRGGLVKVSSDRKRAAMVSSKWTDAALRSGILLPLRAMLPSKVGACIYLIAWRLELKDSLAKEPARPLVKTVVNEELVGVDFGLQRSDVEKA